MGTSQVTEEVRELPAVPTDHRAQGDPRAGQDATTEMLPAPPGVSPSATTEEEQHEQNDQYGLHGHDLSPPTLASARAESHKGAHRALV